MIKKLKNKLPKSEFARNVLTLMTGTTIAQAIPIAISPILTRIYTPENFGVFALYVSIISLLAIIATGRYELAIVLPKKKSEAIEVMKLCIIINVVLAFLIFLIFFLFNSQIANLLGNKEISKWLYFVPISFLAMGGYQVFNYWNIRSDKFKVLSLNKVYQSTTNATTSLSVGFMTTGVNGIVLANIISQVVATLILIKKFLQQNTNNLFVFDKIKLFALARRYKKMPLLNMPNAFIDASRISGINILISIFFSTTILGFYSLAYRMVQLPMSLVGASLTQVLFSKMSRQKANELLSLLYKIIIKSALIGLIPFLILYYFSPFIFSYVFGKEWEVTGKIVVTLVPWLYLNFITMPISNIFIILNKQEVMFYFSVCYAVVPLLILYFLRELDFLKLIEIMSWAMTSLLILFIFLVIYTVKKEIQKK